MPNAFMYKRVNIFLLILMCLIVVGLAGSAIYFQESFKKLTSNYDSVLSNYTTCTQVLSDKETRLFSCVEELNSTGQDIVKYDTLYEEKVEDLQAKETELQMTDRELKEALKDLRQTESQYAQARQDITALQNTIKEKDQKINTLEDEKESLQNQLNACEASSGS